MNRQDEHKAATDAEAARAAELAGAPLIRYGLVLRDQDRRLCWFNRAHSNFAAIVDAVQCEIVGFLGITEEKSKYINVDGKEEYRAEINELGDAMILAGLPGKDTLFFLRVSRQEVSRRIESYNQKRTPAEEKLISQFSQVPEYVEVVCLYGTEEDPRVFWLEEPNTSQWMN
jgi:hypothetical protein